MVLDRSPYTRTLTMSTTNYSQLEVDFGQATSTAGAATVNKQQGIVVTEALTTPAGGTYGLVLTNSAINGSSIVFVNVQRGTLTTGQPTVSTVTPVTGSATIVLSNVALTGTFNGTLKLGFFVHQSTSLNS